MSIPPMLCCTTPPPHSTLPPLFPLIFFITRTFSLTLLSSHSFPCPLFSLQVSFPIVDDPEGASLIAWTTTPWTLPSNLALCVHPGMDYVRVSE